MFIFGICLREREKLATSMLSALPLTGCESEDRLFSLWSEVFYSWIPHVSCTSTYFFKILFDAFGTLLFWPPPSFIFPWLSLTVPQLRFNLISMGRWVIFPATVSNCSVLLFAQASPGQVSALFFFKSVLGFSRLLLFNLILFLHLLQHFKHSCLNFSLYDYI